MIETSIAGSLPKPAWLAETNKLWPQWAAEGDALRQAKADATLLWIKAQEDAGLDIVCDGEQSRQHFVHGFLEQVEGIDFEHKVKMGIRDNRYDAMVPQVVSALRLKGRVHAFEAQLARAHTKKKLKFTLPGPMTIVDTVADRFYGGDAEGRIKMAFAFAELLNQEALALQADGVDIIQFDEPAFNVYMKDAADWGVQALERAAQGLTCTTAVHICYGYGIKANTDWKSTLGEEWRQYEAVFPALAKSRIDQVSLECIHSHVPPDLIKERLTTGSHPRSRRAQLHQHLANARRHQINHAHRDHDDGHHRAGFGVLEATDDFPQHHANAPPHPPCPRPTQNARSPRNGRG